MAGSPKPQQEVVEEKLEQTNAETAIEDGEELKRIQTAVDGSTTQYENGQLRLIPTPSRHPDDPLNFPMWQKVCSIAAVSLFGASVASTQQIVAGMLPIFMFVYAGQDPSVLNQPGGFGAALVSALPEGLPVEQYLNPLEALGNLPGAERLSKVNLLYSVPMLITGLINYLLVPASIAFGRRAVLIFCALTTTACTIWAGLSTSLTSHLIARCLHAIGTGATDSLITLVIQDMTFVHQRNRAISSTQLVTSVTSFSIGVGSTYIVANLGWRVLYFICAAITGLSTLMIILFVRETRWQRTSDELRGEPLQEDSDNARSAPAASTLWSRYGILGNGGFRPKAAWAAFIEIIGTFLLPIVTYLIIVNAVILGIATGASLTTTAALLSPPYNWPFSTLGLVVIAGAIASLFVVVLGIFSDRLMQWVVKRHGGRREAEWQLYNLIFPVIVAMIGAIVLGVGGQYLYQVHWMAIVMGMTLLAFGLGVVSIVSSVVTIEAYPKMAGPVLVNVATARNLVAFGFTQGTPEWTAKLGYMSLFGIFAGVIVFVALPLPFFIKYGKRMRESTRFVSKVSNTSL